MIEIYFDDLKADVQQEILERVGVQDPADMNWDVWPICVFEINPDNEEV